MNQQQTPNLARRAKRHAWAPTWRFFAACPPGLEPVLAAELEELGFAEVAATAGGVEFSGRLAEAYRANLWLRSAGRVLLRLKDFRVRRFSDLPRQAAAVPWEVFLPAGCLLAVQVSLRRSNLRHAGQAAQAVFDAACRRLADLGLEPPRPAPAPDAAGRQMVMVRGQERRALISLDTSGEHLHRRGYRLAGAKAPLRENLAAALLLFCGYRGDEPLLDAMCGSGTLAIEAALLARRLPPALERGLALEDWPAHHPATWRHLRRKAREAVLPRAPRPIHAWDLKAGALRAARENAARAGVEADLTLERGDFFSAPPPQAAPGLLVCNPPYGRRLGNQRQARQLVVRLGGHLRRHYQGWRVGLVLHRPQWIKLVGLKEVESLLTSHGGLKVCLVRGRVG